MLGSRLLLDGLAEWISSRSGAVQSWLWTVVRDGSEANIRWQRNIGRNGPGAASVLSLESVKRAKQNVAAIECAVLQARLVSVVAVGHWSLPFLITHRNPRWLVDVSTASAWRAAGR